MKTILTVIALCVACSSFAQIEKGRSYVTGQLGGYSVKSDYTGSASGVTKQNSYDLTFGYGYLIANTWAVGLSAGVNGNKSYYNSPVNSTNKTTGYSITPYVRKYFPIADKFYIHLDGGLRYGDSKLKYKADGGPESTNSNSSSKVFISPGLTYFLSDRFTLNANLGSLNYTNSQVTNGPDDKTTQKGFNASFGLNSVTFGASIFF